MEKDFYFAEKQVENGEIRYKIAFELSSKYDLIAVITEEIPKSLKVITAYKTSKKIKKKWQIDSKLAMRK